MYELIWVGENTYYIAAPCKVGVYDLGGGRVCLIDSGSDTSSAKKIKQILDEKDWELSMILSTHSHADHAGGNHYLQDKTGCMIYGPGPERAFMEYPILEPSLLYGGSPPKDLRNKFLMAQPSTVEPLTEDVLPPGIRMLRLDGHSMAMCAFCTDDDIWFLADAVMPKEVLEKYQIPYLYDISEYLQSLNMLMTLEGRLLIPAHTDTTQDLTELVLLNRQKVKELLELVLGFCRPGMDFEGLLKRMFDYYGLTLNMEQYVLAGSTIRSCLSYLSDQGRLKREFSDNRLFWRTNPEN